MILFTRISYKNFLSAGNKPLVIQLDKAPVTIVTGTNGTGKSSGVIDAIYYALYGRPYRKLKNEQLINSINKKQLEVELDFTIGSVEYRVVRGLKPGKFEVYVDGVLKEQLASKKDYQVWLEDSVLKMNPVTMKQIVFLGSTSYIPFMRLCPNDRRKVVEEILDIQVFSIMNNLIKGRAGVLASRYQEIQNNLKVLANTISLKTKHLNEMRQKKSEQIAENEEQIVKLKQDISSIQSEIETSLANVQAHLLEIDDASQLRNNKSELDVLISNMRKNKARAQKDLNFFEDNNECPTCQQHILEDTKQESIELNEEKITKCMKALVMAEKQMDAFDTRLSAIVKIEREIHDDELKVSNNQTRIGTIQEHIGALQESIEKLSSSETTDLTASAVEKEIDAHEEESTELRTSRADISDKSSYYQVVSSLLKDSGIKSQIINNYLPTINSLIRKYLEIMEFSCEFTFDDNFNETMKSRYRDTFSYANFSEGQKLRIDLALLFTWRELARLRNSATCNLLVLDEVGSSSLDAAGTEAFMRIVEETSDKNNVFIISHDSSVTETDIFSRCLHYTLADNFSQMKEIT